MAAPKTLVAADETLSRNATMENMMLWRSAIEGAAETCLQALTLTPPETCLPKLP